MKLWGRQASFNVQKVCWLLGELHLEFEHEELGERFGGLDTKTFVNLNPHRKVPVLQDSDVTLWESHTILRYLAATYGGETWWPGSAAARSQADRWLDWLGVLGGLPRGQPSRGSGVRDCQSHGPREYQC